MSQLRKAVRDYLTMRRSLGFKLTKHEAALLDFVSFLAQRRCSHITVKMALAWATRNKNQRPDEWAARLSIVRGFARHWSATDPSTEIPPVGLLPYRPQRARPYIYSDDEIRKLLEAAKARPSIDPLRSRTYYCLFGLLAVTGLRLGEALNLRVCDMDWTEGMLTIRGAKFGKSRLVPLHASTCKVLADYATHRDRRFGRRLTDLSSSIRMAIGWTRARSIGPSTACPGRSDCALWMRAVAHACTISGTALRSRLCFGGIATETIRNADCPSCLPIWDTPMSPIPTGI